jgi:hypothetical protein
MAEYFIRIIAGYSFAINYCNPAKKVQDGIRSTAIVKVKDEIVPWSASAIAWQIFLPKMIISSAHGDSPSTRQVFTSAMVGLAVNAGYFLSTIPSCQLTSAINKSTKTDICHGEV